MKQEDIIRNQAWFECLSAILGTTQLTHALAKIESMQKDCSTAADWIEQCPFENAITFANHLRAAAMPNDQAHPTAAKGDSQYAK